MSKYLGWNWIWQSHASSTNWKVFFLLELRISFGWCLLRISFFFNVFKKMKSDRCWIPQLLWWFEWSKNMDFFRRIPEGVSPWALLRLAGGGNVSNFEKLTFFFWILTPLGPKKIEQKNFFEIRKFQCFSVSLFQCFSRFLLLDYLRIYHVFRQKTGEKKVLFGLKPCSSI